MFCPNCGTKNDGVEMPCKKCGFKLSSVGAPKFRGTMMLSADQSVQELIEEHRRKQAEEGLETAAPAPDPSGSGPEGTKPAPARSGAPLFGMPGTLQPPRAGLPKRRMGTMMGVAPQVGGVQPPEPDLLLAGSTPAPPPAAAGGDSPTSPLDPLGGTVAVPVLPFPAPPSTDGLLAGRTEAFEAVAAAPHRPAAPPAAPPLDESPPEPVLAAPAGANQRERRTEPLDSIAPAPRRTEPLESVAPPPRRRRVRPLDVFLILITFGLYGFVLLAQQRKRRPDLS